LELAILRTKEVSYVQYQAGISYDVPAFYYMAMSNSLFFIKDKMFYFVFVVN